MKYDLISVRSTRTPYKVSRPVDIYAALKRYATSKVEKFFAISLDGQHAILHINMVSVGTTNRCMAVPRDISHAAVKDQATALVVAHLLPLIPSPCGGYHAAVKDAENQLAKLTEAALRRYSMIEDGDRILVAVSGGKDSTSLAYDLAMKRRWWPVHYEVRAIHIATDFCSCCKKSALFGLLSSWEIEALSIDVPVIGRLKSGRSMNCYWCSTQRRTELLRYAMAEGFNKIALGHHLDDIVETLMMNMLYKGQISGMLPSLRYDKYPVSIIRPLALCEERQVIAFAEEKGFRSASCTCPYGRDSKRREVRARIQELTGGSSLLKRNLFDSMSNVNSEYLP